MSRWLIPILLVASSCDRRTDDELRTMIGEVAAEQVRAIKDQVTAIETKAADDRTAKNAEIAALRERVTALENALAATNARIDTLAKPPPVAVEAVRAGPAPTLYKMTIGDAHTRGPASALVTIVVWSDFQCPHCAKVAPTFDALEKAYGSDVRFVFKHCPLSGHPRAKPAAIAAEAAAEQGKFWEMHDKLFANMQDLTDASFVAWAKDLGLDRARFERDLGDAAIERRVTAQRDECTGFDVSGVPSFFVNGRAFEGANDLASFKPVIDERLREAKALVAKGTARDAVYDTLIAAGKGP